jgi:hypothetical protein
MQLPSTCPVGPGASAWFIARDSGGDAQERSVPQQVEVYRAYCDHFGLVDDGVYVDIARPGDSAEDREGLQAMLAEARRRWPRIQDRKKRQKQAERINHVVVFWKSSRVGRDQTGSRFIKADLRIRGLQLISLSDPLMTGEDGIDMIVESLLEWKDEVDLEIISSDARRGLHAVVSLRDDDPEFLRWNPDWEPTGRYLGVFPGREPPRGFVVERIRIGTRRTGQPRTVQRLVPDPALWERARLAWKMRVQDEASYRQIHELTALYKTPNGYTTFFRNAIYTGVLHFGGEVYGSPIDPFVEPLIPLEWFEIEAERRKSRACRREKGGQADGKVADPRARPADYLLTGLLVCARCGSRLWGGRFHSGKVVSQKTGKARYRGAWRFYECGAAKRGHCDARRISAMRLEEAVLGLLKKAVLNPDALHQHLAALNDALEGRRADDAAKLAVLEAQLVQQRQRVDNLVEAVATEGHSDALLSALRTAETAVQRLAHQIALSEAEAAHLEQLALTPEAAERIVAHVNAQIAEGGELAKDAVAAFVSSIVVDSGKRITGHVNLMFPWPVLFEDATGAKPCAPKGVRGIPLSAHPFDVARG